MVARVVSTQRLGSAQTKVGQNFPRRYMPDPGSLRRHKRLKINQVKQQSFNELCFEQRSLNTHKWNLWKYYISLAK
jgi:hypothetical protein